MSFDTITYPKEVKANKEHRCNFCGDKILLGETYQKATYKYDGQVYDWKTHIACAKIADRLNMYEDADEGVSDEAFQETINCRHDDLMIAQLPKGEERNKYSDIIQQLRRVRFKDKLSYVIRYYAKLDQHPELLNNIV